MSSEEEINEVTPPESAAIALPPRSRLVEALLFASPRPLPLRRIAEILGEITPAEVRAIIDGLSAEYRREERAFEIVEIAGGYRIYTRSAFYPWVEKLELKKEESTLTPAGLQVLTIVAYRQPVTRAEIESIRGVGCGQILKTLTERGLVRQIGRSEKLGAPSLYGTTSKFLEIFGLSSLKDLPRVGSDKPGDSTRMLLLTRKSEERRSRSQEQFSFQAEVGVEKAPPAEPSAGEEPSAPAANEPAPEAVPSPPENEPVPEENSGAENVASSEIPRRKKGGRNSAS